MASELSDALTTLNIEDSSHTVPILPALPGSDVDSAVSAAISDATATGLLDDGMPDITRLLSQYAQCIRRTGQGTTGSTSIVVPYSYLYTYLMCWAQWMREQVEKLPSTQRVRSADENDDELEVKLYVFLAAELRGALKEHRVLQQPDLADYRFESGGSTHLRTRVLLDWALAMVSLPDTHERALLSNRFHRDHDYTTQLEPAIDPVRRFITLVKMPNLEFPVPLMTHSMAASVLHEFWNAHVPSRRVSQLNQHPILKELQCCNSDMQCDVWPSSQILFAWVYAAQFEDPLLASASTSSSSSSLASAAKGVMAAPTMRSELNGASLDSVWEHKMTLLQGNSAAAVINIEDVSAAMMRGKGTQWIADAIETGKRLRAAAAAAAEGATTSTTATDTTADDTERSSIQASEPSAGFVPYYDRYANNGKGEWIYAETARGKSDADFVRLPVATDITRASGYYAGRSSGVFAVDEGKGGLRASVSSPQRIDPLAEPAFEKNPEAEGYFTSLSEEGSQADEKSKPLFLSFKERDPSEAWVNEALLELVKRDLNLTKTAPGLLQAAQARLDAVQKSPKDTYGFTPLTRYPRTADVVVRKALQGLESKQTVETVFGKVREAFMKIENSSVHAFQLHGHPRIVSDSVQGSLLELNPEQPQRHITLEEIARDFLLRMQIENQFPHGQFVVEVQASNHEIKRYNDRGGYLRRIPTLRQRIERDTQNNALINQEMARVFAAAETYAVPQQQQGQSSSGAGSQKSSAQKNKVDPKATAEFRQALSQHFNRKPPHVWSVIRPNAEKDAAGGWHEEMPFLDTMITVEEVKADKKADADSDTPTLYNIKLQRFTIDIKLLMFANQPTDFLSSFARLNTSDKNTEFPTWAGDPIIASCIKALEGHLVSLLSRQSKSGVLGTMLDLRGYEDDSRLFVPRVEARLFDGENETDWWIWRIFKEQTVHTEAALAIIKEQAKASQKEAKAQAAKFAKTAAKTRPKTEEFKRRSDKDLEQEALKQAQEFAASQFIPDHLKAFADVMKAGIVAKKKEELLTALLKEENKKEADFKAKQAAAARAGTETTQSYTYVDAAATSAGFQAQVQEVLKALRTTNGIIPYFDEKTGVFQEQKVRAARRLWYSSLRDVETTSLVPEIRYIDTKRKLERTGASSSVASGSSTQSGDASKKQRTDQAKETVDAEIETESQAAEAAETAEAAAAEEAERAAREALAEQTDDSGSASMATTDDNGQETAKGKKTSAKPKQSKTEKDKGKTAASGKSKGKTSGSKLRVDLSALKQRQSSGSVIPELSPDDSDLGTVTQPGQEQEEDESDAAVAAAAATVADADDTEAQAEMGSAVTINTLDDEPSPPPAQSGSASLSLSVDESPPASPKASQPKLSKKADQDKPSKKPKREKSGKDEKDEEDSGKEKQKDQVPSGKSKKKASEAKDVASPPLEPSLQKVRESENFKNAVKAYGRDPDLVGEFGFVYQPTNSNLESAAAAAGLETAFTDPFAAIGESKGLDESEGGAASSSTAPKPILKNKTKKGTTGTDTKSVAKDTKSVKVTTLPPSVRVIPPNPASSSSKKPAKTSAPAAASDDGGDKDGKDRDDDDAEMKTESSTETRTQTAQKAGASASDKTSQKQQERKGKPATSAASPSTSTAAVNVIQARKKFPTSLNSAPKPQAAAPSSAAASSQSKVQSTPKSSAAAATPKAKAPPADTKPRPKPKAPSAASAASAAPSIASASATSAAKKGTPAPAKKAVSKPPAAKPNLDDPGQGRSMKTEAPKPKKQQQQPAKPQVKETAKEYSDEQEDDMDTED